LRRNKRRKRFHPWGVLLACGAWTRRASETGSSDRCTGAWSAPACNGRDGADSRGAPTQHATRQRVRSRDGPRLRGDRVRGTDATTQSPKPTTQSPKPTTQSPKPTTLSPKPTTLSPKPTTQSPHPRRSRRINATLRVIETLRAPVRHLCAGAFCVQARALAMGSRISANCPKAGSEPGDCLVGARGGWQRHGTRPRAPRDRTHRRGSASTLERDPCRCDECQWIESQRPRVARAPARSAQRSSARGVAEDSRPPARDSCATPRVRGRPGRGFPLRSMRMGLCLRGAPARRR
jgi:hypothetical protein